MHTKRALDASSGPGRELRQNGWISWEARGEFARHICAGENAFPRAYEGLLLPTTHIEKNWEPPP